MTEEELNLEIKNIPKIKLTKKTKVFLLLLIPLFLAVFFRSYPYHLPYINDLAEQNIDNALTNQIQTQIASSYPNLNQDQISDLVNEQVSKYKSENKDQISQQKKAIAAQIADYYQDEKGRTYILSIDPYIYILQAENYLFNKDKQFQINNYYSSVYNSMPIILNPYFIAYSYKIVKPFFNVDVTDVAFAVPLIISALAIIPAFFITRRLSGNIGGLFAASMLALNTSFLARSPAGAPDTDHYNVLFPLLIVWILMESFIVKGDKKRLGLAALAGLITGIFAFSWSGWWYVFDFILGTIGIYLIFILIKNRKNLKEKFKDEKIVIFIKNSATYLITSGIFVSIISGFSSFISSITNPIKFTSIQNAARANYWPNVYTTVAELNRASFSSIISSVGGNIYFILSLLGIALIFWYWRKKTIGVLYSILLSIWFVGTIYAATQGVRFIMNFAPAFSIAFGCCLGLLYYKTSDSVAKSFSINKKWIKVSILIIFLFLMIQPIKDANASIKYQLPLMNDDWYYTLQYIKAETPQNTIIASWWDYGWWFMSTAERQVIFNGGSQNSPAAHWVGKALITKDEKESANILRMLVCGRYDAYNKILEQTGDEIKTYSILSDALKLNREGALNLYKQNNLKNADELIELTHCENPPNVILITSDDMVSKAGVWGHFGLWDFEKSYMYLNLKDKSRSEFTSTIIDKFGYTQEEATKIYNEFSSLNNEQDYNSWISPYPGYSNTGTCNTQNNTVICSNGVVITNNTGFVNTNNGLVPIKNFITKNQGNIGSSSGVDSVAAGYNEELQTSFIGDNLQIGSVFQNLFFFQESKEGYYKLLYESDHPGREKIYVWEVNFQD